MGLVGADYAGRLMSERYSQRAFRPPPGATEIVLVRHGASADAVPGRPFPLLDGHGDPPLSPVGEQQAAAVAERLEGSSIDGLFVTGLSRTVQTAAPLAARLGLSPVEVPELREVKLGDWEGGEFRIRVQSGDELAMRAILEEDWAVIPGAESMEGLASRVRAGVEAIVSAVGPDASAVAVVHGGIIGELCRQATGSRPFAFIHSDNCSITRVVVLPDGRWLLRTFNDVAHLNSA
jgi:probable phosphoglycerate mutase